MTPHARSSLVVLGTVLLVAGFTAAWSPPRMARTRGPESPCETLGWFPDEFGLKDHTLFLYDGYYYLMSTYLPWEDRFAYARSLDLCNWEIQQPVLRQRAWGAWDEWRIWSPFVYEEDGTYYLYYTGVTRNFTQSIMLATSTNPADPQSWEPVGMVFQPDHPGMIWRSWRWGDCRDPMVIKVGDVYHLFYTGRDRYGGIVGFAVADSPQGPWFDWGAMIPPDPVRMPESPAVVRINRRFYLFYNESNVGEVLRVSRGPAGPWSAAHPFPLGWAHEFWQDRSGGWYASYLTDHTITIAPLAWTDSRRAAHTLNDPDYVQIPDIPLNP